MKKMILIVTVIITLALTACTGTLTCGEGQYEEDGICVGNPDYDSRSLVTDECVDLENIGDYQPVWCEEFDYEGLPNSEKWFYDVGGTGWGNNELQYYTANDLDNASVSDGTLKITAIEESMSGKNYTSARLVSKYRGDWLYGRFEVRAKLPEGDGTWNAIWMLPTDWEYGDWPASGEIDIMEQVGYDPYNIHATIHTESFNHKINTQIGYSETVSTATSEFHTYTLEWEPHYMEFFVDGESIGKVSYNALTNIGKDSSEAWPFDQRFHMILNVAVGGSWGGLQGVDDSTFPQTMEIDYIRVYQKDYAGMDYYAPSAPTDLSVLDTTATSLEFMWDYATDDVMVKEYNIYIDDELVGTTSVNTYLATELDPATSYKVEVQSVDFADSVSEKVSVNLTTDTLPSILNTVEAESYSNQQGVVREDTNDVSGSQHVTWLSVNDYMEYELLVEEAGTYKVTYRTAGDEDGEIKLYGKGVLPLATTLIPSSGSFDTWIDVESDTFTLTEGAITIKVKITDEGFNLNYFTFEKID